MIIFPLLAVRRLQNEPHIHKQLHTRLYAVSHVETVAGNYPDNTAK